MNSVFGCDVQNFQKTKSTAKHYKHGIKESPMLRKIFVKSELNDNNPNSPEEPVNGSDAEARDTP